MLAERAERLRQPEMPHRIHSQAAAPPPVSDLPLQVVHHPAASQLAAHPTPRRRWWWLLLLVMLALIAWRTGLWDGIVADRATQAPAPVPPRISVFALGRLEPEGEVLSVASPSGSGDARVEQLQVVEGMQVEAQSVLAVLDNEQRLLTAVRVAEESLEQARLKLERTQLETQTTLRRAQAGLRSTSARLSNAKLQLKRLMDLRSANAVSQDELDMQQLEVELAEQSVVDAAAQVDRYTPTDEQVVADIRLAAQEVQAAQAAVEQARANLEQAYIRAPSRGEILQINVQPGERVGQQSLLEMGLTDRMWARVEVYESEVPRLRLGQSVSMTASPLATPLRGQLVRITPLVQQQSIVNATPAANTDARVVIVWVQLDEESSRRAAQFVNLQVRAEFHLDETRGAPAPPAPVHPEAG